MATVLTYDIPSKHADFKKMMFQLGYKDQIAGTTSSLIYFPNTTLYHSNKSAVIARDEAQNIAKKLAVNLERCIATEWGNWAAICGEPFK